MESEVGVKLIRMEEVEKHNREAEAIWTVIHGKVYEMTKFLEEHPGGGEILLENAGMDSSEQFDDVGHSSDAHEMLGDLFIGNLHPDDIENLEGKAENWTVSWIPLTFALLLSLVVAKYAFSRK
eukprot:GFUD01035896.1.p1 GENE.GFUD01035896.1~~GFUD01035896.1.p1  ORF type:complete len:124 (+),score=34.47 GFUD01035896.1:37-408(+)